MFINEVLNISSFGIIQLKLTIVAPCYTLLISPCLISIIINISMYHVYLLMIRLSMKDLLLLCIDFIQSQHMNIIL